MRYFGWFPSFCIVLLAGGNCALADPQRSPARVPIKSCAELHGLVPDAPCRIAFERFRGPDPRLAVLASEVTESRTLFSGKTWTAANAADLNALSSRVRPGDRVFLSGRVWRDQVISFKARGERNQPILVAPADPGLVLTGSSRATFSGENIVVYGLQFRDGIVDQDSITVLKVGASARQRCDSCVVDSIRIENYNSRQDGWRSKKVFYLSIHGVDVTVARSNFLDKQNRGTLVAPEDLPESGEACTTLVAASSCFQRLHFVGNVVSGFARVPSGKDDGGYKVMQLGWSGIQARSAYSIIEDNVFEHANGGNETLSIKAADVIIRNNVFHANRGVLNLRAASRVLVEHNRFSGGGQTSAGGVRIEGAGHWIVHNVFEDLVQPQNQDYFPISMRAAAEPEVRDGLSGHAQVRDVVIARNIFRRNHVPTIAIGTVQRPERPYLPTNVFIVNNEFDAPDVIQYVGGKHLYAGIWLR